MSYRLGIMGSRSFSMGTRLALASPAWQRLGQSTEILVPLLASPVLSLSLSLSFSLSPTTPTSKCQVAYRILYAEGGENVEGLLVTNRILIEYSTPRTPCQIAEARIPKSMLETDPVVYGLSHKKLFPVRCVRNHRFSAPLPGTLNPKS